MKDLQPAPGWPVLPIPQIPIGYLVATTRPDGAEVYLDGKPVLDTIGRVVTTPVTVLNITTGKHRVTFRKDGYFDEDVYVYIENGLYSDAYAVLRPITLTLSSIEDLSEQYPIPYWQFPYGHIAALTVPDGAEVYIDGQPALDPTGRIVTTPAIMLNVPIGDHWVTFKKDGYHDEDIPVYVDTGTYSDAYVKLRSRLPVPRIPYTVSNISLALGDLFIDSNPQGAYIYIDGNALIDLNGRALLTPVRITAVREGLHEVQISLDRYYSKKVFINVIPDQVNNVSVTLQPIWDR